MQKNKITQTKFNELQEELNNLIKNIRPQIIEELKEARAQGDLSENADYDAARNKQAEIESKITEIENIIKNSEIYDGVHKTDFIDYGSIVSIKNLKDNKEYEVSIGNSAEIDPFKNIISEDSPIGAAIIGKKAGDIINIKNISKPYKIEIIKIK